MYVLDVCLGVLVLVHMWKAEDSLVELVISLRLCIVLDQNQVCRLWKQIYLLSYVAGLDY